MIYYQKENIGKSYDYRSRCHESWQVTPHIHAFSELAFTKSGCQTVCVNGKKYSVQENHAILILPNQIHEYTAESRSFMRCAVFSNDFVPLFFTAAGNRVMNNPVVDFSDSTELWEALEHTAPEDKLKLCGLLNLICSRFLNNCEFAERTAGDNHLICAVIDYISENYRQNITLKELSEKLGYNEKYLSHTLHAVTGMNFRTFLASYRIEYAKQLLCAGELSITDIALECGFLSFGSFNRAFRQCTGKTPSEYRKMDRTT